MIYSSLFQSDLKKSSWLRPPPDVNGPRKVGKYNRSVAETNLNEHSSRPLADTSSESRHRHRRFLRVNSLEGRI